MNKSLKNKIINWLFISLLITFLGCIGIGMISVVVDSCQQENQRNKKQEKREKLANDSWLYLETKVKNKITSQVGIIINNVYDLQNHKYQVRLNNGSEVSWYQSEIEVISENDPSSILLENLESTEK